MKLIVVLGYKLLKNGKMSNILIKRLDKAINLYKKNDVFILSGGKVQNVYHSESYNMKKYITKVLPQAKIITESLSKNTKENIHNIYPILKKSNCRKIIITSKNHISRVKKILTLYNLKDIKILN